MKKSSQQKMLRRRITTILRPNVGTMLEDVTQFAKISTRSSSFIMKDFFDVVPDNDATLSQALRLEQLLMLALHPTSPSPPLQPVPCQRADPRWAEPGWRLITNNPDFDFGKSLSSFSLLPIDRDGHMSQTLLSTCCSSGRQAASLIKPRHLRLLTDPLSATCQASGQAKSNSSEQNIESIGKLNNLSLLPMFVNSDTL
jgi:hypothetical protein